MNLICTWNGCREEASHTLKTDGRGYCSDHAAEIGSPHLFDSIHYGHLPCACEDCENTDSEGASVPGCGVPMARPAAEEPRTLAPSFSCDPADPCGLCIVAEDIGTAIIPKHAGSCSPDDTMVDYAVRLYCDGRLDNDGISEDDALDLIDAKRCDDCDGFTIEPHTDDAGTWCVPCREKSMERARFSAMTAPDGRTS